jgi:hypothetical protein
MVVLIDSTIMVRGNGNDYVSKLARLVIRCTA